MLDRKEEEGGKEGGSKATVSMQPLPGSQCLGCTSVARCGGANSGARLDSPNSPKVGDTTAPLYR